MESIRSSNNVSAAKTAKGGSPDPAMAGSRGVTLIELLVVVAIIGILATVLVVSQSTFNKTLILANTAYDVALTIRSAQTFGLGTRLTSDTSNPNTGYGVHFEGLPASSFKLFADMESPPPAGSCHTGAILGGLGVGVAGAPDITPGNCMYNSSTDTFSTIFNLGNGMKISGLRVNTAGTWTSASWLDITFARPNTKTYISTSYNSYSSTNTSACITISSPQSTSRYIRVESTGQISVNNTACP